MYDLKVRSTVGFAFKSELKQQLPSKYVGINQKQSHDYVKKAFGFGNFISLDTLCQRILLVFAAPE